MGFTAEDRHLMKSWNASIGHCVNWQTKYANSSCNFFIV